MLSEAIETYGHGPSLALSGGMIGLLFGFFAQRSRSCLRAAVIEFWHRRFGEKFSIWLLAFSVGVISVQLLVLAA